MENNEVYALPDLSSTPIDDLELVEEHLRPGHQRYISERRSGWQGEVNAGLPRMDPWDLIPAVSRQAQKGTAHKDEERREMYFLTTDCVDMSKMIFSKVVEAPQGLWKRCFRMGWAIRDKSNPSRCVGFKKTYGFYTRTGHPSRVDTETNWIMNVYFLIDHENCIQNDMALCHVFEKNSPDYDPRPECASLHCGRAQIDIAPPKRSCGSCSYEHSGKPCNEAIHGPSRSLVHRTAPRSLSTHHGSDRPSDPRLTSWIAQLENLLLGDEPEISTDAENYDPRGGGPSSTVIASGDENGQSRKRTRNTKSDVWQRFTKIFAHGPDGVVLTLAACNHCCKVLTGDSSKGTSHLRRHNCSCNH